MKIILRKRRKENNSINNLSAKALCFMMICVELGNKHDFLGIKIAYWGCALFAISVLLDIVQHRFRLFSEDIKKRNFQRFLIVWVGYGIIQSLVMALMGYEITEGITLLGINVILGVVLLTNTNTKKDILRYIDTVSIMLCICSVISLWELTTGQHIGEITYYERYYNLVFATFYNQNDYCTFLCLGIILQIVGIKLTESKRKKFIYISLSVISMFFAYKTESRASYICLILFFILWICYTVGKHILSQNIGIFSVFIMLGSVLLVVVYAGSKLLISFDPDRYLIYNLAGEAILSNPIFGYGPSGLAQIIGYAPHNLYLQMLGDYGVLITSFFAYFTIICFMKSDFGWNNKYRSILCSFAIIIPILGCSSSNIQRIRIFWMTIAICFATLRMQYNLQSQKLDKE